MFFSYLQMPSFAETFFNVCMLIFIFQHHKTTKVIRKARSLLWNDGLITNLLSND